MTENTTPLPECMTLELRREGFALHVTFNRPEARNAMSFAMVEELMAVFGAIRDDRSVRAVVLRGKGGHFCAGGDVKDMAQARMSPPAPGERDPLALANRRFGTVIEAIDAAPQAVIAIAEGAVMGGGFGLLCVSDVAIAKSGCKLKLPETSLGIPPAQIAPFIVRRIGLTQARRFAVTGASLDAAEALRVGLVHELVEDDAAVEASLAATLGAIARCAPQAIATTKALMQATADTPLSELLDRGADAFAEAARGPEGIGGMTAFIQKQPPPWAQAD